MHTVNLKLDTDHHEKLMTFCRRFGVSKTDLIRFMLDYIDATEVTDDDFELWFAHNG